MANAEIEKTLKKITDTQLVIVRLMETHEREWNKRFEGLRGRTENLERGAEHLLRATEKLWRVAGAHERRLDDGADRIASLEDGMRTMLASMDKLFKTMEDFIKGLQRENGRQ